MTDTDRMVVWLREAMDAAQADAETATPGPWHVTEYAAGSDYGFDAGVGTAPGEVDVVGHGYEGGGCDHVQDAQHIARHNPAAVLHRIAADRKILDDCDDVLHDFVFGAFRQLAFDTVRNLAEGYGWTEETT